MEQRNVQHKHHITRLNVVAGSGIFLGEDGVGGGDGDNGRSVKGGSGVGGGGGGGSRSARGGLGLTASSHGQQRLARAAAEATEAKAVAAMKAAEDRVAAQRAKADRAHRQRLRMAVPDTLRDEAGAWEKSTTTTSGARGGR